MENVALILLKVFNAPNEAKVSSILNSMETLFEAKNISLRLKTDEINESRPFLVQSQPVQ